ncbi:MAG: ABC-2 family transporter protein [Chloroflexota bacterium]
MRAALHKTRVLLEVWFAYMSAYRAEIVIWILSGSLPLIMLAVWIGKANAEDGTVNGFTPSDFAAYFLAAWLTQQITVAWVSWELDYQIRLGELSAKLLRPFDVMWEHLSQHVTERLVRLPFIIVILSIGVWLVPNTQLTPGIMSVVVYALSAIMAFMIRFLISYCIGLLTFWFDQATALDELYFVAAAFLTGSFAPLEFYPPAVRAFIEWTPFPYTIYYPIQMLTGTVSNTEVMRILIVQLSWISMFALIRLFLWKHGLRRYGAFGA